MRPLHIHRTQEAIMVLLQAILYILAVVLVALAAFGVRSGRVSLALLGAASFILGFTLPTITTL
jgi:hypothetical protein